MSEPEQATRDRAPEDRKTLEDAFKVACAITDRAAEGLTVDSEQYTLAAGFLLLCDDLAGYWEAIAKGKHYCGWCEKAGRSRADLPQFTLEEVREHTVACEHNPLVREIATLRAATTRFVELTADNCPHNRAIEPDTGECLDCGTFLR